MRTLLKALFLIALVLYFTGCALSNFDNGQCVQDGQNYCEEPPLSDLIVGDRTYLSDIDTADFESLDSNGTRKAKAYFKARKGKRK